jgi:hypothetical protein
MKKLTEEEVLAYWRFSILRQQTRRAQLQALGDYALAHAIGETLRRVWELPGARAHANRVSHKTAPLLLRQASFTRSAVKADNAFRALRKLLRQHLEKLGT